MTHMASVPDSPPLFRCCCKLLVWISFGQFLRSKAIRAEVQDKQHSTRAPITVCISVRSGGKALGFQYCGMCDNHRIWRKTNVCENIESINACCSFHKRQLCIAHSKSSVLLSPFFPLSSPRYFTSAILGGDGALLT